MKINLKIISIIIFILLIAGGAYYYFQIKKGNLSSGNNDLTVNNSQEVEAIIFARNITFEVPNNSSINMNSSPNSVIILDKNVGQYDSGSYQDLLTKKAIIIQSFPPMNKNKQIFQNYINERYTTTDKYSSSIEFTTVNNYEKAVVNIDHQKDNFKEYVEILNLDNPVIIVASEKTDGFIKITNTIKNIASADKDVSVIRKQLQLIGTLLRSNLVSDLYSLFSSDYKKNLSLKDFQSNLDNSRENIKSTITVNGGLWLKSKDQFICKPIFKNADLKVKEVKNGQLVMTKENGRWLISSIDLPKD